MPALRPLGHVAVDAAVSRPLVERLRAVAARELPPYDPAVPEPQGEAAREMRVVHPPFGNVVADVAVAYSLGQVRITGCALSRRSLIRQVGPRRPEDERHWLYGRRAEVRATEALPTEAARALARDATSAPVELAGATVVRLYPGNTGEDGRVRVPLEMLRADLGAHTGATLVVSLRGTAVLRTVDASPSFAREVVARTRASPTGQARPPAWGHYEEMLPEDARWRELRLAEGEGVLLDGLCLFGEAAPSPDADLAYIHFATGGLALPALETLDVPREVPHGPPPPRWKRYAPARVLGYVRRRVWVPLRWRFRGRPRKVNFGAGTSWRHPDFLTLDIDPRADVVFNLALLKPLPFDDGSLDCLYTSHCLEHLPRTDARHLFREAARCLRPGGVLRITCPDAALYLDAYERRDLGFYWAHLGREANRYDSWLRYLARVFGEPVVDGISEEELKTLYAKAGPEDFAEELVRRCEALDRNYVAEVLPQMHKSWWTPKRLVAELLACGFREAAPSPPNGSRVPAMRDPEYFDTNAPSRSLRVEAVR